MVKVINIDTKTRTIRIDNADSDIKTWRTTETGTHFPIKKGESTKEALDKFVAKKQEESPAMRAAREASERMSGLKLAIGDKKNGVKKAQPAKKEDDYDLKFASDIKKGDIVSAGGRDYKIIQADRNWVIGLDDKGLQLKINTEASFDTFKVKKQQPAKKESSQPTSYDLDDAFEEADLGAEWSRVKHRMDSHGVDQYTIKDIIDSGMYEAGDIIEALESNSHDKIDEMKKMADKTVGEKRREAQWEKQFGPLDEKKYQEQKAKKQPVKKERSWWRGPRESEDAYFERRDKTMAEARQLDKVSDWFAKAYAGQTDIPKNKDITFDELADKLLSGKLGEFYEAVGIDDSDTREAIFQELSERTGKPYDDFYDAWLHGGKKGTVSRVQKQKAFISDLDKLLKSDQLVDPELKRLIINARNRAKKEIDED